MAVQTLRTMTVAEYLEWEERQECKHEYIDGEIVEMTGGTSSHSRIKVNMILGLGNLLDPKETIIYNSDMRVKVGASRYIYPDLSVVQREAKFEGDSELTLLNPDFVVEVTSPTSHSYDRVDKFGFYLDVPSIEAYLIIDQDRVRADLCTRADEGWYVRVFNQPDDLLPLDVLSCELPLADVYRGIEFVATQSA